MAAPAIVLKIDVVGKLVRWSCVMDCGEAEEGVRGSMDDDQA